MQARFDALTARKQRETQEDLERRLAEQTNKLAVSHEASLRDAVAAVAAEKDAVITKAREALAHSEERCRAEQESAAESRREAAQLVEKERGALRSQSDAAAQAMKVAERRHMRELEEALGSLRAEHRLAVAVAEARAEKDRSEAVAATRTLLLEEAAEDKQKATARTAGAVENAARVEREKAEQLVKQMERRATKERQERDAKDASDARRLADEIAETVRGAVEAERLRVERRHRDELEKVASAGALATRVASETVAREGDDRVAMLTKQVHEEGERRRAAEAAMELAAKKWGLEVNWTSEQDAVVVSK